MMVQIVEVSINNNCLSTFSLQSWKSLQMLGKRPNHSIRVEEIVPRESEFLNPDQSSCYCFL